VRGLFEAFPFEYSKEVAELLARLCCHHDQLPQGAPSSPIISNYICKGMDRQLAKLALRHRCFYTRYADDLVFSTDRPVFPTALVSSESGRAAPSDQLARIIETAGFRINGRKTRIQICFQRQRVTGLIVNQKVNVTRRYIRAIRAVLHTWEKQGPEEAALSIRKAEKLENHPPKKPYPSLGQVMRGRVQYVGAVRGFDDPVYLKLARKLSECDPHFRPPTTVLANAIEARLYTEGPTDPRHIRAALAHFQGKGEFLNLKLIADENSDQGSDQKLLAKAKYLREFPPHTFAVCLFDTDTKVAQDAVGEDGWAEYGKRAVAVGVARPQFREKHELLCIELLHEDSVLETGDADGRRIFQMKDFDPTTSIHVTGKYVLPNLPGKSLIAEPVYEIGSNDSVARPKAAFARAVEEDAQSFGGLSFLGFRPTFERIATALASLERANQQSEAG
jgi:RNA-directed DNA polymerase